MRLTYAELEDFFAELHHVAPEKRTALKGRLKHFQRLNWPAGTNKGKGARVEYGIGQTMSLAMGLELLQLGLTPEKVVHQLREAGTSLASGFIEALDQYGPHADKVFYAFSPEALQNLRADDDDGLRLGVRLMVVSQSELAKLLGSGRPFPGWRRFALIDITDLFDFYVSYFVDKGLGAPDNLREPLVNWLSIEQREFERLHPDLARGDA